MVNENKSIIVVTEKNLSTFPAKNDGGTFGALTIFQANYLVEWAIGRGLDAWSGHVCLMYGNPYVTISGYTKKVRDTGEWESYDVAYMLPEEKKQAGYTSEDWVVKVNVWRKGISRPFPTVGLVSASEIQAKRDDIIKKVNSDAKFSTELARNKEIQRRINAMPIFRDPRGMAEKRGLMTGFKRAFGIEFPTEPTVDTEAIETTGVDLDTGEVIGKQPASASPAPKVENTTKQTEAPPEAKQGQTKAKLSPEDVDRVSRALTAAGYIPTRRQELYDTSWFKNNFPGFVTIPEMSKEDAERLIQALEIAVQGDKKPAKVPAPGKIMPMESGEAF